MTPIDFIQDCGWSDLPKAVQQQTRLCLLDLIGVAAGGAETKLSIIIRDHAAMHYPGNQAMLFDGRPAGPMGCALAAGMTIDALDGHDGYNPAKGHIGCPLFPAILALGQSANSSGAEVMAALAMGYEFGARASAAQHATVQDYHTSGSWGAVTAAAAGARLMRLDRDRTRHALGIAEYHGPRSQMMRCIDHPTMVKDGSGWGAMAGVSAVLLAEAGFTGAPAITVEQASEHWHGLGEDWLILQQYFKPYPVCRWAQAPIEGILALRRAYGVEAENVARIEVESFHEAVRLAVKRPQTTEEAQYSTSFPCAVAMVRGAVRPEDLQGPALHDPETLRLSESLVMTENEQANAAFPERRLARVTLKLRNGSQLRVGWMTPKWDAEAPPTELALRAKFHDLADSRLGPARAHAIEEAVETLDTGHLDDLIVLLSQPLSDDTRLGRLA